MTYRELLSRSIETRRSHLCVGLDPVPQKISGSVEDFLVRVVGETAAYAAAYKPNIAFFEALGSQGYQLLEKLRAIIPRDIPFILDAKRSDIPDTQAMYARAYFDVLQADAVTLNAMLGRDSLRPFLADESKGVYVLGLTSNPGSADFLAKNMEGRPLWKVFVDLCTDSSLGPATMGAVMGLTNQTAAEFAALPDIPLLIPGLGAQGGDADALAGLGARRAPWLVNASRSILYPPEGPAHIARAADDFRRTINRAAGRFPEHDHA
jgi:orotidine 5'-phosphate decarboxylase subfamily 2